jgi:tetratricopeptide (TPR) repeat protein
MIAVELVEPINVAVLPLAFLALGAATAVRLKPDGPAAEPASQLAHAPMDLTDGGRVGERTVAPYALVTSVVALALALFVGVTMVTGDAYMFRGTNFGPSRPFNLAAAKDANRLLPYWPDPALELAQIKAFDSLSGASDTAKDLAEARQWTAIAVSRDSDNPQLWTLLALADVHLKAYGLARSEFYRALSCDRWFTQALQGLGQLAGIEGNWGNAVHFYRLAITTAVDDAMMTESLRELVESAEQHARSGE